MVFVVCYKFAKRIFFYNYKSNVDFLKKEKPLFITRRLKVTGIPSIFSTGTYRYKIHRKHIAVIFLLVTLRVYYIPRNDGNDLKYPLFVYFQLSPYIWSCLSFKVILTLYLMYALFSLHYINICLNNR